MSETRWQIHSFSYLFAQLLIHAFTYSLSLYLGKESALPGTVNSYKGNSMGEEKEM